VHQPLSSARLLLWTTSGFGVLCLVLALAGYGLPLVWLCVGLGVHVALATAGVLAPSLSVYGDVLSRGPASRAEVALTFDDGPHPDTTRRVLALLAQHGIQATFFVVGEKVRAHPEVAREIVAAGHAIGLHGFAHDRAYALRTRRRLAEDVRLAQEALFEACGVRARLFRPPIGFVSYAVAFSADRAGLSLVGFSARTRDGSARATPEGVLARATAALQNGAILLLHDAAERDDRVPASLAILSELCAELARRGLRAVTVEALRRQ